MKLKNLILQQPSWPPMRYDRDRIAVETLPAQGVVDGKLAALGLVQCQRLTAEAWTQEAVATAAIEGERLDNEHQEVRAPDRRLARPDRTGACRAAAAGRGWQVDALWLKYKGVGWGGNRLMQVACLTQVLHAVI
jgi:hypothetical protein